MEESKGTTDNPRRSGSFTSPTIVDDRDASVEAMLDTYMVEARGMNFTDLKLRRVLYKAGVDASGRSVFVFTPRCAFEDDDGKKGELMLRRMFLYFLWTMREHVREPYCVVYCHTRMSWFSKKHFQWLRNMYKLLGRDFRKNLKAMYVVHHTRLVKLAFFMARPFLSKKFYEKLNFVKVCELEAAVTPAMLRLPQLVREFEGLPAHVPKVCVGGRRSGRRGGRRGERRTS